MTYAYRTQPVLASELCFERDADSFFNPVGLRHTGFASDGVLYSAGVAQPGTVASWFSEPQGDTRGPLATFPAQALVIVARASLVILDATTDALTLWMLFYFGDTLALANNAQSATAGYLPSAVSWSNGLLSITMQPDAGSTPQAPVVLTIDFVEDSVYSDTHA